MAPDPHRAAPPRRQILPGAPIIPAIPYRLSRPQRAARPITPEEGPSDRKSVTQQEAEPQQLEHKDQPAIPDPLTPETQTSTAIRDDLGDSATENSVKLGTDRAHTTPDSPTVLAATSHQQTPEQLPAYAASNGDPLPHVIPQQQPPQFHPAEQNALTHVNMQDENKRPTGHSARGKSHTSQTSVSGIVFGALQDPPVAPLTPQLTGSNARLPPQAIPRQPPGLMRPGYASPFYPGHAHHHSQSQAPWVPPTLAATPVDGRFVNDTHFQSQFAAPGLLDGAYSEPFSPGGPPITSNGIGTSRSESPARAQFPATQPSSEHGEGPSSSVYQNGTGAQSFAQPLPPKLDNSLELSTFISCQIGNPDFADCVLRVRSPSSLIFQIPASRLVISRSEAVAIAYQRHRADPPENPDPLMQLDVFTEDQYVTRESVHEAVKILYGFPFLTVEDYCSGLASHQAVDGSGTSDHKEPHNLMAGALSYAAAGKLFRLRSMHRRGLELTRALLRWDTLEMALEYGLDASIYSRSREDFARSAFNLVEVDTTSLLVEECIEFLARHFPATFNLYRLAPELSLYPRLPNIVEARQPTHNARLSGIRFGEVPVEDEPRPDYVTRVISSILLSLPLPLLNGLFNHPLVVNQLGVARTERAMRDIVGERERRRRHALNYSPTSETGSFPSQRLYDNVIHEEQVSGRTFSERRVQQLGHV